MLSESANLLLILLTVIITIKWDLNSWWNQSSCIRLSWNILKRCEVLLYWIINFQIWFWCLLIIDKKSSWAWLFPWTYPITLKHVVDFLFTAFKIVRTLLSIALRRCLPRILHIHFWGWLRMRLRLFCLLCLCLLIFNTCSAQFKLNLLFLFDDLGSCHRFFLFGFLLFLEDFDSGFYFHFILWYLRFSFNKLRHIVKAIRTDLPFRLFPVSWRLIFLVFLGRWASIKYILFHSVAVLNLNNEVGVLNIYCLLPVVCSPLFLLFIFCRCWITKLTIWWQSLFLWLGKARLYLDLLDSRGSHLLHVLILGLVIYMI